MSFSENDTRHTSLMDRPYVLALMGGLVAYALSLHLRLLEYTHWAEQNIKAGGEWLMSTNDAYGWLGGAKGVTLLAGEPFSEFLAFLHSVSGVSLANLGFWTPVIIGPLVALPVALLLARWSMPMGALPAGLLASANMAYLTRTRLGDCDTDMLTLLLPTILAASLAMWLEPLLASGWRNLTRWKATKDDEQAGAWSRKQWCIWLACSVLLGLVGKALVLVHPSSRYLCVAILGCGVALALTARPGQRIAVVYGASFALAACLLDWSGQAGIALAGLAAAGGVWTIAPRGVRKWLGSAFVLGLGVGAIWTAYRWAPEFFRVLQIWLAPESAVAKPELGLPDTFDTLQENQPMALEQLLVRLGGWMIVPVIGLAGYAALLWRRPGSLVFLPMLVLGATSLALGNRFSMYAAPVLGLGAGALCVLGASTLRDELRKSVVANILALALSILIFLPHMNLAEQLRPNPVIKPAMAEGLLHLSDITEPDAMLWTWWPLGYAASYYAERKTVSDGSRFTSRWTYPMARVLSTNSSLQARGVILDSSWRVEKKLDQGSQVKRGDLYKERESVLSAMSRYKRLGIKETEHLFESMRRKPLQVAAPKSPQYIIITLYELFKAHGITKLGSHNLETGEHWSVATEVAPLNEVLADFNRGVLSISGQEPILLSGVADVKGLGDLSLKTWYERTRMPWALGNRQDNTVMVFTGRLGESMMVRLLIDDPERVADDFTLILDYAPLMRVYRVNEP